MQYKDEEFKYIEHSLKSLKVFIFNARKKLLRCTYQINLRKTTPQFPLPTDLSLYPLTHITHLPSTINQISNTNHTNQITNH